MLVQTDADFERCLDATLASDTLVVDLETNGLRPHHGDRLIGVALRTQDGNSWYVPFRHGEGFNFGLTYLARLINAISMAKHQIGWNYKFDLQFLMKDGMPCPLGGDKERVTDAMLYLHLCDENQMSYALKKVGAVYYGVQEAEEQKKLYDKLTEMGYKRSAAAGEMWRLPASDVAAYAEQDVNLTWRLYEDLVEGLKEWELLDIARETDQYLLITTKMEYYGLQVDTDMTREYLEEALVRSEEYKLKLQEVAGYPINLNSPKQLGALLNVPSTAAKVLEEMYAVADEAERFPLRWVLDYRAWNKVGGTYYARYLEEVDQQNVLHTSLNMHGTVTGRLSSRNPNLHAVPRASAVYRVKDVFVARPGTTLVSIDYSQAELRLAAHYSKDPNLVRVFAEGLDLHQLTADQCGITRQRAKNVNFGILYNIGAKGLMGQLGCDYVEASETLEGVHAKFPGYRRLSKGTEMLARSQGFIRYWTGRVRRYDGHKSPYHKAMPNLIQGGVSEILRTTILRLDALMPDSIKMLMQIHDQILFEVPDELLAEWLPKICWVMEDLPFDTPFKVDVQTGHRWGKLKGVDVERTPC